MKGHFKREVIMMICVLYGPVVVGLILMILLVAFGVLPVNKSH